MSSTAQLLDEHGDHAQVCLVQFRSFGAIAVEGRIATVRCFEDNVILRRRIEEPGDGRVLVVDGGGSQRCALLGDDIASLAQTNGWIGIVVNGCVRDSVPLDGLDLAVKALGTNPRPSRKEGAGAADVPVRFGGVEFAPGAWLCADADGVVVLPG